MAKKPARVHRASGAPRASGQIREFRLAGVKKKPIHVQHRAEPMKYVRRERIHPRRVLPRVMEGKPRVFPSLSRPLFLPLAGRGSRAGCACG